MKMSLGRFISERRKRLFLTQEELAKRMHVSKSAIAKWETDGGIPDRDNLYNLAEIMGVSVDYLHRIIDNNNHKDSDVQINITSDIFALLESYGYKITGPEEE